MQVFQAVDQILDLTGLPTQIDWNSAWLKPAAPLMGMAAYGGVILGLRAIMKNQKAMELKWFNAAHNAFLCLLSLAMTLGIIYEVAKDSFANGFFHSYCDVGRDLLNTRVFVWVHIFYLSKYYEFIDTVILVLRKKPLTFLHTYHHIATCGVVYLLVVGEVVISWQLTLLNAGIHTFMYYYYTVRLLGGSVWWKKYLTSGQIAQFFTLLASASVQIYWYFSDGPKCSGDIRFILTGFGFVISLVVLFIQFFNETYTPARGKANKDE